MSVSYHSAAERPEPPHEEQSQQEEQHQQGDQEDGAIELQRTHNIRTMLRHAQCYYTKPWKADCTTDLN